MTPRRLPWTACVHFRDRRLSSQFQFSLSAAALGIYLHGTYFVFQGHPCLNTVCISG
jgi:hypothetical protein